jgi:hypothetical protein
MLFRDRMLSKGEDEKERNCIRYIGAILNEHSSHVRSKHRFRDCSLKAGTLDVD